MVPPDFMVHEDGKFYYDGKDSFGMGTHYPGN